MRIGDIARQSGLSTSRIRFYERHGMIPAAPRADNGYRNYPDGVLETLHFIDQAQNLGFTLEEIRAVMAHGGSPATDDVLPALHRKLATLTQHIEDAMRRRQRIVALVEKYESRR